MAVFDDTIPVPADPQSGPGASGCAAVTLDRLARVLEMIGVFTPQQRTDFVEQMGFELLHLGE